MHMERARDVVQGGWIISAKHGYRRGEQYIIHYCVMLGFSVGVVLINIPPALDVLMAHYQVSYLKFSVLISAMLWPHTLVLLPAGFLADRINLLLITGASLTFIALGNLTAMLFPSLEAAMLGRVLTGLGTGTLFVVTMKLAGLHAPQGKAGMYQAVFGGSVSLGCIAAFLVIPHLATLHWKWAYGFPGLLAALCLIPIPFLQTAPNQVGSTGLDSVVAAGRTREAWLLGLAHALSLGTMLGLGGWTPALFAESLGSANSGEYAWFGALLMLVAGLARFAGGALLMRLPSIRVIWLSMVLLGAAYVALFMWPAPMVVMAVGIMAMCCATANFAAIFQVASHAVERSAMGSMIGLINFVANLGAIGITMACGWFKEETGSFSGAFVYIGLSAVAAGILHRLFLEKRAS